MNQTTNMNQPEEPPEQIIEKSTPCLVLMFIFIFGICNKRTHLITHQVNLYYWKATMKKGFFSPLFLEGLGYDLNGHHPQSGLLTWSVWPASGKLGPTSKCGDRRGWWAGNWRCNSIAVLPPYACLYQWSILTRNCQNIQKVSTKSQHKKPTLWDSRWGLFNHDGSNYAMRSSFNKTKWITNSWRKVQLGEITLMPLSTQLLSWYFILSEQGDCPISPKRFHPSSISSNISSCHLKRWIVR